MELSILRNYLSKIKTKFIEEHIKNKTASQGEYSEDVKSYCILAHANIEHYFEIAAETIMLNSINIYEKEKKITVPLFALVIYKTKKTGRKDINQSLYDISRILLNEIKSEFSTYIRTKNHGINIRCMENLFMPIGIDLKFIEQEPDLKSSLEKLSMERGCYAHRIIQRVISPEDAVKCIEDCVRVCEEIEKLKNEIIGVIPAQN